MPPRNKGPSWWGGADRKEGDAKGLDGHGVLADGVVVRNVDSKARVHVCVCGGVCGSRLTLAL